MDKPTEIEILADLLRVSVVDEAMDLLNDGYPLDDTTIQKLKEVGIEPFGFIEKHEDKID